MTTWERIELYRRKKNPSTKVMLKQDQVRIEINSIKKIVLFRTVLRKAAHNQN